MNKCPQCGRPRKKDDLKCPVCDCFYSKLDEILATDAAEKERKSLKGRLKSIINADNPKQSLYNELQDIKENTPRKTMFTFFVIFVFVFALVVSVL